MNLKPLLLSLLTLATTACQAPGDMLFVRHKDADMPVLVRGNTAARKILVFVHGGPGGTSVGRYMGKAFQTLEKSYGVAYWDQRMAGDSQGNAGRETLGLDQHVQDLDLAVDVLRQRYPGSNLYLMGHSWGGSLTGSYLMDAARQAKIAGWLPTNAAFSMVEGDRLSRDWAMTRAQERIDQGKDVALNRQILDWYGRTPVITAATFVQHQGYVSKLGGYVYDPQKADRPDLGQYIFGPAHSVGSETVNLQQTWQHSPIDQLVNIHLIPRLSSITLPTKVLHGRQDGILPAPIAQLGYDALGTPASERSLQYFEASAHRPMDDEPAAFVSAVKEFMDRY